MPLLAPHDLTGSTFFIACNMMLAFTAFFFMQVNNVPKQWRQGVTTAGLVTGVAFYNYTFMKDQWVQNYSSPMTYRYTDWLITVPLQIVEFYLLLKAGGNVSNSLGWRLFLASLAMIAFGWLGELEAMPRIAGWVCGMVCWIYIIVEVFSGEASTLAARMSSNAHRQAYNSLRMIVTVGWCIYPLGYILGYAVLVGHRSAAVINIIYNLADLVNKGLFGMCIYSAAMSDQSDMGRGLMP